MVGTIVNATSNDSIRITRSDGSTVQIPAVLILAMDRVLRRCLANEVSLEIDPVEDDAVEHGWQAKLDMGVEGASQVHTTPWNALISLAKCLEKS